VPAETALAIFASRSSRCATYSSIFAIAFPTTGPCAPKIAVGSSARARERREVVDHVPLGRVDDDAPEADDQVAGEERARALLEEAQVAARMAGREDGAKRDVGRTFEAEELAVLDEAVDADRAFERLGRHAVCGDRDAEPRAQVLDASYVIGVQVRDDDLAHAAPLGGERVEELVERGLLVLVGRARVDDDELTPPHDVAVRVRRGRPRRRADGEEQNPGAELDAADLAAARFGDRREPTLEVVGAFGERAHRV
jgi:hypothetical protein